MTGGERATRQKQSQPSLTSPYLSEVIWFAYYEDAGDLIRLMTGFLDYVATCDMSRDSTSFLIVSPHSSDPESHDW